MNRLGRWLASAAVFRLDRVAAWLVRESQGRCLFKRHDWTDVTDFKMGRSYSRCERCGRMEFHT